MVVFITEYLNNRVKITNLEYYERWKDNVNPNRDQSPPAVQSVFYTQVCR